METKSSAATIRKDALAALEQGAPIDQIQPLLRSLADLGGINDAVDDSFGLTISMHAAALGNLEVVTAAHALETSLFEVRNKHTNANLLHYAAQAVSGGAEIINWAILEANAPIELLSERIVRIEKGREVGNGHTVAMEAAFNNNADAIRALIDIRESGRKVDLETPALTGWTPRGLALRDRYAFAKKLPPAGQELDEARTAALAFATQADDAWVSAHPGDKAAIELAVELRKYVLQGGARASIEARLDSALAGGVDINTCYGRLGQPLLNLVPTDPSMSQLQRVQEARYAEVVDWLTQRGAKPWIKELAPMAVGGGFREAVFGYRDALARMIERVPKGAERQAFIDERGIMNGYTRLIDAALKGRTGVIELLLDCRAEKRIKGFNGRMARDTALLYNSRLNSTTTTREKIPDQVVARLAV
jgi:hypothetical protein